MKKFLLFDARARYDIDKAMVFTVSDSLKEAKRDKRDFGSDSVIVQYDTVPGTNKLANPEILND